MLQPRKVFNTKRVSKEQGLYGYSCNSLTLSSSGTILSHSVGDDITPRSHPRSSQHQRTDLCVGQRLLVSAAGRSSNTPGSRSTDKLYGCVNVMDTVDESQLDVFRQTLRSVDLTHCVWYMFEFKI